MGRSESSKDPKGGLDRTYWEALQRGDFVLGAKMPKGFPILREWGLMTMRRIVDAFLSCVAAPGAVHDNPVPPIRTAEDYAREVADFGGFEDVYNFKLNGQSYVLTPDAAVHNIRCLLATGRRQVVARYQGFRSVRGATPPFFRDRFIYPFVQFNRIVPAADRAEAEKATCKGITEFFDELCLPVRIVDFGPWKSYARRLFAAVSHLPDGRPTIVAMFYVVGDNYRRICCVPEDLEVFDVGITEKVLAVIALRHRDEIGVRLPSHVSPIQLVATEAALKQASGILPSSVRTAVVETLSKRPAKAWRRRGVPLQLHRGTNSARVGFRSGTWSDLNSLEEIPTLLDVEDDGLWQDRQSEDLRFALPPFCRRIGDPVGAQSEEDAPVCAMSRRFQTPAGATRMDVFLGARERAFY